MQPSEKHLSALHWEPAQKLIMNGPCYFVGFVSPVCKHWCKMVQMVMRKDVHRTENQPSLKVHPLLL